MVPELAVHRLVEDHMEQEVGPLFHVPMSSLAISSIFSNAPPLALRRDR